MRPSLRSAAPIAAAPAVPAGTLDDHQLSVLDMMVQLTIDQYHVPGLAVALGEDDL
jgi:hypothetical protein